jgi:uncharacterized protein YigE (DUF2233 family)
MKKTLIALVVLLLASAVWLAFTFYTAFFQTPAHPVPTTAGPTLSMSPKPVPSVALGQASFAYAFFRVPDLSRLSLIPNFKQKSESQSLMRTNGCTMAINGGFYDKNDTPLGFFVSGKKVYGSELTSNLANGFVWVASGAAVISTELPHLQFNIALQTGPLLLFDGNVLPLTIKNDSGARRMLVAKTNDNTLLFMTVYRQDSVFDGPLLGDLPEVVQKISRKENLGIADAVNLDGGSASAFYNGETALSELTAVGSLFCVK